MTEALIHVVLQKWRNEKVSESCKLIFFLVPFEILQKGRNRDDQSVSIRIRSQRTNRLNNRFIRNAVKNDKNNDLAKRPKMTDYHKNKNPTKTTVILLNDNTHHY